VALSSAKTADYVVAKAVRDGVVDATIHHEESYVRSHDLVYVYVTKGKAEAFHRRNAHVSRRTLMLSEKCANRWRLIRSQLEASRGNRRKRSDAKTDEEKAQDLQEEFDDDY
jgi:26S proteasome regulatory subunit N3